MPHAFEWALLRVVPRVERGECLNAGAVVYCQGAGFLGAVVELDEGTRLIANLARIEPGDASIGMRLELDWLDADPDLTLPVFRRATSEED